MICLGATFSKSSYITYSELECGYGQCDLLIQPINQNDRGFIFEIKSLSKQNIDEDHNEENKKKDIKDKLENQALLDIKQIENRQYYSYLEQFRIKHVTIVGLAFCGKKLSCQTKDLTLQDRDYV